MSWERRGLTGGLIKGEMVKRKEGSHMKTFRFIQASGLQLLLAVTCKVRGRCALTGSSRLKGGI